MTEAEAVARTVVEALKPLTKLVDIAAKAADNAVLEAALPAMTDSPGLSKAYEGFLNSACRSFLADVELQSEIEKELAKLKGLMNFVAEWTKAHSKQEVKG